MLSHRVCLQFVPEPRFQQLPPTCHHLLIKLPTPASTSVGFLTPSLCHLATLSSLIIPLNPTPPLLKTVSRV